MGESPSQRACSRLVPNPLPDSTRDAYNDGDVDVGSLLDGLRVGAGVGNNDETGLLERAGDVVGEVTGGEATGDGGGTGVGGELQDGTLTVGTGRDNADIGGVVDGGDDTGGQDDLLPLASVSL